MKKILPYMIGLFLLTVSCESDTTEEKEPSDKNGAEINPEDLAQLQAENERLMNEMALKDSALNQSMKLYNDIESNLSRIAEGKQRIQAANIENQEDPRAFIMQEIEAINEMREDNVRKIRLLNQQLGDANIQIEELSKLVETLTKHVAAQELEIEYLKEELMTLDGEYSELFEAYTDLAVIAENRQNELNQGWYSWGSSKELMDNGVITKDGGFIGIGRVEKLREDFNKDYFERIDIKQTTEIEIIGKKPEILTTHPENSYGLVIDDDAETAVLKITDPESFWGISKYLVVVVK